MKFYRASSSASIDTFTINGGEYQQDYELDDVCAKYARFSSLSPQVIQESLWDIWNPADAELMFGKACLLRNRDLMTPNEWANLVAVADFCIYVDCSLENDGADTKSRSLHICDLNSGAFFTWIHSVCY
jgi:hypothetical protein